MANESFKELMQCIEEETDKRIKEIDGIKRDFLKYEYWTPPCIPCGARRRCPSRPKAKDLSA